MTDEQLKKNLLIFSLLCTQSELYGYSLKGKIKDEFARRLDKYLATSKQLLIYINKHIDADTLEDNSQEIAEYLETLTNNPN